MMQSVLSEFRKYWSTKLSLAARLCLLIKGVTGHCPDLVTEKGSAVCFCSHSLTASVSIKLQRRRNKLSDRPTLQCRSRRRCCHSLASPEFTYIDGTNHNTRLTSVTSSVSQWNRWTEIPLIARGLSGVSGCWPVGIASAMLPFVNVRKLVSLRYYRAVASALVHTWARLYRRDPATRPPEQTSLPATTDEDWCTKGCEFCSLWGFGDDAMLCNHAF